MNQNTPKTHTKQAFPRTLELRVVHCELCVLVLLLKQQRLDHGQLRLERRDALHKIGNRERVIVVLLLKRLQPRNKRAIVGHRLRRRKSRLRGTSGNPRPRIRVVQRRRVL